MNSISTGVYDALIRCPHCSKVDLECTPTEILCRACSKSSSFTDGVLDLRIDPLYDTQLNIETYDEVHSIDEKSSNNLYRIYEKTLTDYDANMQGDVLEIASGSGHLTYGLTNLSSFGKIHCSDISPDFMKRLRQRVVGDNADKKTMYYLFDANSFPFKDNIFDVVVGNSVLHHFANFENTLAHSFRVLRAGGVAVFGEPVLDTHALSSLAASLIRVFDSRQENKVFSKQEDKILEVVEQRALLKRNNLRSDRKNLESKEDKFQFPINYMRELANQLGYSYFNCVSPNLNFNLSEMIKTTISRTFVQTNVDLNKLDNYEFIFDSISSSYGEAMKEDIKAGFSLFVFVK